MESNGINPNFDDAHLHDAGTFAEHIGHIEQDASAGLFTIKPANEWIEEAKKRPVPGMLFGEFWREGELCIFFADTNLGKSILSVQISDSISSGRPIRGFTLETSAQTVLYFDFELSDKQFENRYSQDFSNHYRFHQNFLRVEITPEATPPNNQSFEDYLYASLERAVMEYDAKIVIIDNITYLKTDNEKAKDALQLMKHLTALKKKYGLSILALAHTPKRDMSKAITSNDLQGSKMLMNFCDSAFSMGKSHKDGSLRYLKQIKVRAKEFRHDSDNVCVCCLCKDSNFVGFEFMDFSQEKEHLREPNNNESAALEGSVLALHQEGKSYRQIGQELGISHMKAKRIIDCNKS